MTKLRKAPTGPTPLEEESTVHLEQEFRDHLRIYTHPLRHMERDDEKVLRNQKKYRRFRESLFEKLCVIGKELTKRDAVDASHFINSAISEILSNTYDLSPELGILIKEIKAKVWAQINQLNAQESLEAVQGNQVLDQIRFHCNRMGKLLPN